jgi:hypothetical protein
MAEEDKEMKLQVDADEVLKVCGEGCAPDQTIESLKLAMIECNSRLNALSMGTDGYLRSRICIANNILNRALGRTEHFVADNWKEE